ncbi:hypothetical protein [Endozoicomonas sp. ONNA1]|uniref:hypothetical protein n=1 Tax=Endozoicomonas sp. ONNA1 TaxID=2828740 RepID=UPI00214993B2|nr:hypothetical protein [Endozoicomonas sp. ONNA1]
MELKLGMFTGHCWGFVTEIQASNTTGKMRQICRKAKNIYRHAEIVTGTRTEIGKRYTFTKDGNFEVASDLLLYLAICFRYGKAYLFQLPLPIDECDPSHLATQDYHELHYDRQLQMFRITYNKVNYDHIAYIQKRWNKFFEEETDTLLQRQSELVRWIVDAVTSPPGHLHIVYCQQQIRKILNELLSELNYESEEEAVV